MKKSNKKSNKKMPNKIKKQNPFQKLLSKFDLTTPRNRFIIFVSIFALIGTGYLLYKSYASTASLTAYATDIIGDSKSSKVTEFDSSKRSVAVLAVGNGGAVWAPKLVLPQLKAGSSFEVCSYVKANQAGQASLTFGEGAARISKPVALSQGGYTKYCAAITYQDSYRINKYFPTVINYTGAEIRVQWISLQYESTNLVTAIPPTSPITPPTSTPSPSPTPTPTPTPTKPALTWSKPSMSNTVTYKVSDNGSGGIVVKKINSSGTLVSTVTANSITADSGSQDSTVVWETATRRRLTLKGGRNWVIVGGEVNNNISSGLSYDDRAALEFNNVLGTIYVEGIYIHGNQGIDGIRISGSAGTPAVYIQNSRIIERRGYNDPSTTSTHADVIQAFGNIASLNVDRLTGSTDYQGQMWKKDTGYGQNKFGPSNFKNVNYLAIAPAQSYIINFVMSAPTEPVTFTNVYVSNDPNFTYKDPSSGASSFKGDFCSAIVPGSGSTCGTDANGRKYKTWSGTAITINGRITQGMPPDGKDYVPAGTVGLSYK